MNRIYGCLLLGSPEHILIKIHNPFPPPTPTPAKKEQYSLVVQFI